MGIALRQSLKTTAYTLAGTAIGAGVTFLLPRFLSKEDIGISRNMLNLGAVFQSTILLGFHTVVITFIPRYPAGSVQRKVLLLASLIIPLVVGLLLCIPYFLLRDWVVARYQIPDRPLLYRYYLLLPLLTIGWSLMTTLESYLAAQMKVASAAFAREILPRVLSILLVALFAASIIRLDGFMVGTALLYVVPAIMMAMTAIRTPQFGLSANWRIFSKAEWREAAHFAWYHLLAGITFQLIGIIDALMLASLDKGGIESVATYTIAILVASFVMIPYRAISASVSPLLNRAYIDGDEARVRDLFARAGINMTIAGVAIFVIIACNLHNVISLLPRGKAYEAAAPLAMILMTGRMADVFTGLNNEMLSISSRYKFLFRASAFLLVVFVALNRVLIPRYSYWGAASSAAVSLLLYNVAKSFFLYLKFGLLPFAPSTMLVLAAGAGAALAGYFCPQMGGAIPDAVFRSGIIAIVFTVLIYVLRPSADVHHFLKELLSRLRR